MIGEVDNGGDYECVGVGSIWDISVPSYYSVNPKVL